MKLKLATCKKNNKTLNSIPHFISFLTFKFCVTVPKVQSESKKKKQERFARLNFICLILVKKNYITFEHGR